MAIKLLVADVDGTLLPHKKELSARNLAAIRAAEAKGVKVTLATGRMHASAQTIAKAAGISLPIITCNGAMVKSCDGEVIFEKCIDTTLVKEVLEFCKENKWHVQWYVNGELYVNKIMPDTWVGYDEEEKIKIHEANDDFDTYSKNVSQLVVLDRSGRIVEISKILQEKFGEYLFTPHTAAFCIDIVGRGMHKAIGIDVLAKKYGVLPEEIMAIGDSDNDIDMIKYAGIGVAMENAFDSVKEVADYITLSCEEDGFAVAVEKFILQGD